jgi:hypothetical protein
VTFYTDLDSISFQVTRGSTHDFVILLDGRDSALTRIATEDPSRLRSERIVAGRRVTADTIPFTLGRGNKIYVRGSVNGSDTLDLMFDTGANRIVLSELALRKGVELTYDGTQQNAAFGGTLTVRSSSGNRLQVGGLRWRNVPLLMIEGADGDGIIGYNAFEEKVVEIDYDRRILIVRDSVGVLDPGYTRLPLRLEGGLMFVPAALVAGGAPHAGFFELDSGASWSLFVSAPFAAANGLGALGKLGERSSGGLGGNRVRSDLVRLPLLRLGSHSLRGVPIDLEQPSGEQPRGDGILGMDVLRRFNTVLDLREYEVYLKPNGLAAEPYNEATIPNWKLILAIAIVLSGLGYAVIRAVQRRRHHFP